MNSDEIYLGNLDIYQTLGFEQCTVKGCENLSVDEFKLCWGHLTQEQQKQFRKALVDSKDKLSHIRLASVDLSNLDLSNASLNGAILIECNLNNTIFDNAKMLKVTINYSKGLNTSFKKAKMNFANFSYSIFEKAFFNTATLASSYAFNAKFIHCDFYHVLSIGSTYKNCNLSYSNFTNAKLTDSNFRESILEYCDFTNANIEFSQFSLTNVSNSKFINTKIFGFAPWGIETNNTHFSNLVKNFQNKSNLPAFLYPNHNDSNEKSYILKLNIYNEYAAVYSITKMLHLIDAIFSSSLIWGKLEPPKLMVTTIDKGSVEIKMTIDITKDFLPYINESLLITSLMFIFGIKIVAKSTLELIEKTIDIYIKYKQLDIDQNKEYQLENSIIKELKSFNQNKEILLKGIQDKDIVIEKKIETIENIVNDFILNQKEPDTFKGLKHIEILYPKTEKHEESYIMRIDENGEVHLLDIHQYEQKI